MQLAGRRLGTTWIALAVLVLAVLAGTAAFALAGSTWRSRATVTIVPPQTGSGSRVDENPLLQLDYDLPQFVDVLATSLQSASAHRTLQQQGAIASYTAETGDVGAGDTASALTPQLRFTGEAGSPTPAYRTVAALVLVARDELDRLQTEAGVPGAARATISVLVAPRPAVRSLDGRWTAAGRTALVVVVLGAGCALIERRRRAARATPG